MGLPIQSAPTYSCVLPSNGTEVKFRPFLVKEQKILTIAKETDDQNQIINAIKELIDAVTFGKVDANKLAMADLEYLFLKVRCISVGETSKVTTSCSDTECKGSVTLTVNLDEIEMEGESPENTIMISDDVGVILSWPTVKSVKKVGPSKGNDEQMAIDIMKENIVSIFDGENVYESNEISSADLDEFVDNLTFQQLGKIGEYFDALPKLSKEVEGQCNICKSTTKRTLEGLNSFF